MQYYGLYSITKGTWIKNVGTDIVEYSSEPTLFNFIDSVRFYKYASSISDLTGDTLTVYKLEKDPSIEPISPSITYEMSKHTGVFAPKVAEFIHNTAIRFGDQREDKVKIAKDLAESLDKAISESLAEMGHKFSERAKKL
jgi:hypothetical protein